MNKWHPRVYKIDGDVSFPYWALAAYDDNGVMRYSRESERKYALNAWMGAKDLAMMINRAGLTPESEGTTFTDLPPGRFLSDAEIMAAPRMTQEELTRSVLGDLKKSPPRSPRR